MESFVVDVVPVPTAKRRRSTGKFIISFSIFWFSFTFWFNFKFDINVDPGALFVFLEPFCVPLFS